MVGRRLVEKCPDCGARRSLSIQKHARRSTSTCRDSEEAAKAFFNEELVQRVTGLYGVRPSIAFVEIATLVDNAATK